MIELRLAYATHEIRRVIRSASQQCMSGEFPNVLSAAQKACVALCREGLTPAHLRIQVVKGTAIILYRGSELFRIIPSHRAE